MGWLAETIVRLQNLQELLYLVFNWICTERKEILGIMKILHLFVFFFKEPYDHSFQISIITYFESSIFLSQESEYLEYYFSFKSNIQTIIMGPVSG